MKHTGWLLAALMLAACMGEQEREYRPVFGVDRPEGANHYLIGVHPLHNPERLHQVFNPLADYLSEQIDGARFKLEASRNYAAYDEKLYAGKFHFALPNPFQTINSLEQGYHVIAKMGDDENFRGIILVRKDAGIEEPRDLKGKKVSFPAPTALAATMMPQYYLQNHGLDVMRDIDIRYVGSQESSIMNVYLGETAAGATWPPPWRALSKERPELAKELSVKWRTEPLPNNGFVARADIAPGITRQVRELLVGLHEHARGREILARMELSRFESADDVSYDAVREFVERFTQTVRPLN